VDMVARIRTHVPSGFDRARPPLAAALAAAGGPADRSNSSSVLWSSTGQSSTADSPTVQDTEEAPPPAAPPPTSAADAAVEAAAAGSDTECVPHLGVTLDTQEVAVDAFKGEAAGGEWDAGAKAEAGLMTEGSGSRQGGFLGPAAARDAYLDDGSPRKRGPRAGNGLRTRLVDAGEFGCV
jgi:hypothetical protein